MKRVAHGEPKIDKGLQILICNPFFVSLTAKMAALLIPIAVPFDSEKLPAII